MGPRNANPKSALEIIGTVAAGGSLGGLCLLAEERRRRVALAQKIIENGRRLQSHKSYDTLAPLETFDVGSFWGPKEEDFAVEDVQQPSRDDTGRGPSRRLSNWEWRHRSRKHRPIPTASPTTLHTGSAVTEVGLEHWDMTRWPGYPAPRDSVTDTPTLDEVESLYQDLSLRHAERASESLSGHEETIATSRNTSSDQATQLRNPQASEDTVSSTPPVARLGSPQTATTDIAGISQFAYGEPASRLERVVASRVSTCLEIGTETWIRRGLKELMAYFKNDTALWTWEMKDVLERAQTQVPREATKVRNRLAELRRRSIAGSEAATHNAVSLSTQKEPTVTAQTPQHSVAADVMRLLKEQKAYEAFSVFSGFCESVQQPLGDNMRTAIRSLDECFRDLRLFSIVNEIRQACLHKLKEWRLILDDVDWLLRYQPMSQTPSYLQAILTDIAALPLQPRERSDFSQVLAQCLDWLRSKHSLQSALHVMESVSAKSTLLGSKALSDTCGLLVEDALAQGIVNEAAIIACAALDSISRAKAMDAALERLLAVNAVDSARTLFFQLQHHHQDAFEPLTSRYAAPIFQAMPQNEKEGTVAHLQNSPTKPVAVSAEACKWLLETDRLVECRGLLQSLNFRSGLRTRDAAIAFADFPQKVDNYLNRLSRNAQVFGIDSSQDIQGLSPQQLRAQLRGLLQALKYAVSRSHARGATSNALERIVFGEGLQADLDINDVLRHEYKNHQYSMLLIATRYMRLTYTLDRDCQLMLLHARHEGDAEGLLSSLTSTGTLMEELPSQALQLLCDAVDQTCAKGAFQILLERQEVSEAREILLRVWQKQKWLFNEADHEAHRALLKAFSSEGPVIEAKDFLTSIADLDIDHSATQALSAHRQLLTRCWRSTRNMPSTKSLFASQMELISQPGEALQLCNAMISACVEEGDLQGAQDLADHLEAQDIRPDFESRSHVVLACGKAGEWDEAEELLVNMLQNSDDARKYAHCLDKMFVEYARQHSAEAAVAFFTRIQDCSHLQLTNSVARSFTESILRGGRIELLQQWIDVLTGQRKTSSITQSSFALLIQRMLQSKKLKDNEALKDISLQHLIDADNAEGLVDLMNSRPKVRAFRDGNQRTEGQNPRGAVVSTNRDKSRSAERAMLSALTRRKPNEALSAYKASLRDGIPSSAVDLRLAVTACSRLPIPEAEWSDMAKKLVHDAAAGGMNTGPANEALRTANVQRTAHKFTQAEALQDVESYFGNAKPGRPRYQHPSIALATKLLNQGDAKAAMRVMKKTRHCLRELGQDFSIPAWTTILRILITLDDPNGVRLVIDHIIEKDLLIDHALQRALLVYGRRARNVRSKDELPKVSGEIGSALRRLKRHRRAQKERAMQFGKAAARIILDNQPGYRNVDTQGVPGKGPSEERDILDDIQT